MRKFIAIVLTALIIHSVNAKSLTSLFIEAESFQNKGGWVVDQQFMDLMGSSYLMAHGMGMPVEDAETRVEFPSSGEYHVFVRTFNWTSPWFDGEGPGQFELLVNGKPTGTVLGTKGSSWMWQHAGKIVVRENGHGCSARSHGFQRKSRCHLFYNRRE